MSSNNNTNDVLAPARQAERDLNSHEAKSGSAGFDSAVNESGVDTSVESKFPGASVTYGSAASGAGDNREIPESEGGDILSNGRPTKARGFEGTGGPGDKREGERTERGGDNDI